jgi:cell division protein FtsL
MYVVFRENAIFTDEKEAIAYRDKLNAEWRKDQQWRDLIKSLAETYRNEQK